MFHQPTVNPGDTAATLDIHLVPVALATNADEADRYRIALEDDSIPVLVGETAVSGTGGYGETPVLVPEAFYERASEILAALDVFGFDDWDDDDDLDEDDDEDDSLPEDDDFDDDLDDEDSDDDFDE